DMLKALDPDRFVTCADDGLTRVQRAEESAVGSIDFIMINQYYGTWAGPAQLLPETLDRLGRLFPDKMFIISEFGADGIFGPSPEESDQLRTRIIRDQMALFAKYDWIGGAI